MKVISIHKEKLIKILRFLNDLPGFKRIFYQIHEIRKDEFKPKGYIAIMTKEGYMLGVNDFTKNKINAWRNQMATQNFEVQETKIVKKMLNSVDYFIDIGSHIGYYTCLAAIKQKKVIAFEPNPNNYQSLLKNIKINRFNDIKTYNVALSNFKKEETTLYGDDADSSIIKKVFPNNPNNEIKIKVDILDNYINSVPNNVLSFLKMDIEGAEYGAILGGENLINKIKPLFMFIEIVKNWGGGTNPNFKKTLEKLDQLGYEIFKEMNGQYFFIRKDSKNDKIKKIITEIRILK